MKKTIIIALLFISASVYPQLVINELMPSNVSAVMDDAYNYSMWVEIYNKSTTTSYNLASFYFTDNLDEPKKWMPATNIVSPGGYNILYFERSERTGHSNFKLDPEGGKLYLLNFSLVVIDSIKYPSQFRNISYGRKTDGDSEWVFFEQFSPKATNNGKKYASTRCSKPVLNPSGGFFSSTVNVKFSNPQTGDTIYYTRNGAEPTRLNGVRYTPGSVISVTSTSIIRAKCFSGYKLSGDIATGSFFINEREFNLPVVSIVTDQANLYDNTIGLYCDGTNGITGNGQSTPKNYNQDWDRPVNFELFDTTKTVRLNQEVDIKVLGGWTRAQAQKSIAIMPRKKHGDTQLRYDIFAATKPFNEYKDIQLRNSGNDFGYSMLRDGFMQSLVMKRFDIDYLAYEPAVCFMNGVYFGIQNLRERSSDDFLFSNYGLKDDEVRIIEATNQGIDTENDIATDAEFATFSNFFKTNDLTNASVYQQINNMMDVDEFINYNIAEIYYGNYDWPYNNIKLWKKLSENKWRWILYDCDFGFNLYNTSLQNFNSLTFALGENQENIIGGYSVQPEWSVIVLKNLIKNQVFLNKFIDRFAIHISSTFEPIRVNAFLDSLSSKISNEIIYHKNKFGSSRTFTSDITNMKTFASARPDKMLEFISNRFLNAAARQTIEISSNIPKASFTFNGEAIIDPSIRLKYFKNREISLLANPVATYKFKQWEINSSGSTSLSLITMGSVWKFYDGNSTPATNWSSTDYADTSWKTGTAQLGYGNKGEVTTISYGTDASNKYSAAYFRKSITINNVNKKSNFQISVYVDDGCVVYFNGVETGRYNMPAGLITYTSLATTYNNGETATFNVPVELIKEGNNVIAVEVHQNAVTSSDLIFNLSLTCNESSVSQIITSPVYSTVLNSDFSIKAIYEQTVFEDPDKDLKVTLNEVVASNNIFADPFGEKDDYIEIFNNGDKDVNIAGWYITDTPGNVTLSEIPKTDSSATKIPSKGRIVLWADGQPEQGALHLGFKLSKDGETLLMSKTNSLGAIVPVDSVTYPYLEQNVSYSRVLDGTGPWVIKEPTFNKSNSDNTEIFTPEKKFRVFPNITNEYIKVYESKGNTVQVSDLAGKILIEKICNSNIERIEIGFLEKGIYLVTAGGETVKLIKQ